MNIEEKKIISLAREYIENVKCSCTDNITCWRCLFEYNLGFLSKEKQYTDGYYLFRENKERTWRLIYICDEQATGQWLVSKIKISSLKGDFKKASASDISSCKKDSMGRLLCSQPPQTK